MQDSTKENSEEILTFARFVRVDPQHNAAWLNLGNALGPLSIQDEHGNVHNGMQCYTKCLENDNLYWRAWYNLSMLMKNKDTINVRGTVYSRKDCLVKCLENNSSPETANAWLQLGVLLFDGSAGDATATIDTEVVNDKACYIRALEFDPTLSQAWHCLGLVAHGETAPTVNEKEYSPTQCFVRAVETNPTNGRAWYSLAVELRKCRIQDRTSGTAHVADNEEFRAVSEESCVKDALKCEPTLAHAWCLLAALIRERGLPIEIENVSYSELAALTKALQCDRHCALGWTNLAPALGNNADTAIGDTEYNAQSSSLRALQLYDRIPQAWYNLGATLINKEGDEATVTSPSTADAGASMNAKQCFVRALWCDAEYGRAWYSLGTCMGPSELIEVNGKSHNKYDCIAKGEQYGNLWTTTVPTESAEMVPEGVLPNASLIAEEL